MAMKKEALTNLIADDLASRNDNWTEIDNTFALKADKQQEAWITPTLSYRATGTLQYRINQFGRVEFRGELYVTDTGAIFTLPEIYRPGVDTVLPVPKRAGTGIEYFVITTTGSFYAYTPTSNGFQTRWNSISYVL